MILGDLSEPGFLSSGRPPQEFTNREPLRWSTWTQKSRFRQKKDPEYIGAKYDNTACNSITCPARSLYATTTVYWFVVCSL